MKLNSKKYIYFYISILNDFDLSIVEGFLILLIYSLSRQKGYCYASKKYLSKMMNMSEVSVFNLIKKLTTKKLLFKTGYTENKNSCYSLADSITSYIKKLKEINID